MSDMTLERTVHSVPTLALPDRHWLTTALVRLWEHAVRHAERPGRYVPYC